MHRIFALFALLFVSGLVVGSGILEEPWKPEQLLAPADLAHRITHPDQPQPLLICVGPAGPIKGSLEVGPGKEPENIDTLKSLLAKESRDRQIVIYCGCCPFIKCPNVRPAFRLLNELGFKNHRLLDLPNNLKADWIDKGYPLGE
ncbi:rhodanese-like domain-containing protein [Larkinella soli]|uniref:rhodanese-like domain-containing protein n=1 Tax=Larkinella soli TaxID=1770527 RepID=UPI000FFB79E4|nr:rhodanese-like domain-containing protein [Larkinella soli]